MRMPNNLLVTGPPRVGKTTLIRRLAEELKGHHPVGFYTAEIREGGNRVGFELVSFSGKRGILSHTGIKSPYRVGKYHVDLEGFDRFLDLIPFSSPDTRFIIIDEIGKMECFSRKFCHIIEHVLDSNVPCVATIAQKGTPFIEEIKRREDVRILVLSRENREILHSRVYSGLKRFFPENTG
jgi:nucleoside-triphosphatase